jgi:hypothetical protein
MSDTHKQSRSPRTGQFQKGQSGNPNGRPRKPVVPPDASRSVFDIVVNKRMTITEGGRERELSVEEALQFQTYQDAWAGKRAARNDVLKWIAERDKARALTGQPKLPLTKGRFAGEPRNADFAMRVLGIAAPDECRDALLLEPWAVQAALSRRRGGKALTPKDFAEIQRCTRAAGTLQWPRRTKT